MPVLPAAEIAAIAETTAISLYLVYVMLAIGLVVYLARTLRRNGAVFLTDVFDDDQLADSVNQLLVIGFYLLNLGYAFLLYQPQAIYASLTEAFNELVVRIGGLLLSLGVIHLGNMLVFWRIRTHRDRKLAARSNRPLPTFTPPAPARLAPPPPPAPPAATPPPPAPAPPAATPSPR